MWGRRCKPVPCRKKIRRRSTQRLDLIVEDFQGEARIEQGIVGLPANKSAVLVVLDQVMVRIAGKRERTQAQGVHSWQLQQTEVGLRGCEVWEVEGDQVVA